MLWIQITSASFCYLNLHFLLKRPSIQRKRANLGGPRTFTDSHVCSAASKQQARRSPLAHQKKTLEGNSHQSLTREAVNWGLIAQLPPGTQVGSMFRVQRDWAIPGATGDIVPKVSGTLGFWSSLSWEAEVPPFPVASASWVQLLSTDVWYTQSLWSQQASAGFLTSTPASVRTQSRLKCTGLLTPLWDSLGYGLCFVQE